MPSLPHHSRISSGVAVVLALWVALISPVPAQQTPDAAAAQRSSSWRQIRTPDFTVMGNAQNRALEETVKELAAFCAALGAIFPSARQASPVPTSVVVLRDQTEFERFQPRDSRGRRMNVGGYFQRMPDMNVMVFPADNGNVDLETIFHEYTHYFVSRNVHVGVPMWLNEGLAEFYSTFRREYQGHTMIGAVPSSARILSQQTFVPLRQIVAPRDMEERWRWETQIGMFYAESWALVHYILVGRKNPSPAPLGTYLTALTRTGSQDAAFREAFGTDIDGMSDELRIYVRRVSLQAMLLDLHVELDAKAATQPMLESDVNALKGRLLLDVGTEGDVERELMSALNRDPRHAAARTTLARLRTRQRRDDEALDILRQVVATTPADGTAVYLLGDALERAWRHEEAFDAFTRAIPLNPGNPYPWLGLMQSTMAMGLDAQAAAAMKNALDLEWSSSFYYRQAINALRIGRNDVAAIAMRNYVELTGVGEDTSAYAMFVWALASWRAGKKADADAALAMATKSAESDKWTAIVLQFLQGRLEQDKFLAKAGDVGQRTEAHAYIGFMLDIAGHHADALTHLQWVVDHGAKDYLEYTLSKNELERFAHASPRAQ